MNALKEAISMPAEDTVTRPRQKDSLDELFANFECARIKEYVEKRSRDAVQLQLTVTHVNTVQHSSLCPLDPKPSPDVCFNLENEEGMELDELKSSSAGTGLKTTGQQCPQIKGIWETGKTTASDILTAGAGPSRGENISSPVERDKSTITVEDISSKAATPSKQRHNTFSEQNKQFDPGGREEKAPPWNAAVLYFLFLGRAGKLLVYASCFVRVCLFSQIIDLSR